LENVSPTLTQEQLLVEALAADRFSTGFVILVVVSVVSADAVEKLPLT
jgi:hypothetical protein